MTGDAPQNESQIPLGSLAQFAIQSFAVLVALSVLLGRIYVLEYLRELDIPVSALEFEALDYAMFSPEIALLSVGAAIGFPAVVYVVQLIAERRVKLKWPVFLFSALVGIAGAIFAIILPIVSGIIGEVPGARGLIGAILIVAASSVVLLTRLMFSLDGQVIRRWVSVFIILGGTAMFLLLLLFTAKIWAESDGDTARMDSPGAVLTLRSTAGLEDIAHSELPQTQPICVLLTTDTFTYISRVGLDGPVAIPNDTIDHIRFLRSASNTRSQLDCFDIPSQATDIK